MENLKMIENDLVPVYLTTPTGKPVGFSLPSVARNRTSFSDFGVTSIILFE